MNVLFIIFLRTILSYSRNEPLTKGQRIVHKGHICSLPLLAFVDRFDCNVLYDEIMRSYQYQTFDCLILFTVSLLHESDFLPELLYRIIYTVDRANRIPI